MDIPVSRNAAKVTYAVRNVARRAQELERQGRKLIYLNIGDPGKYDFPAPRHMLDACSAALYGNKNYYAFSSGVDEAREAIARSARKKGIAQVSSENVAVTTGVSEGVDIVLQTLLNPGENILAPVPNYPLYHAVATKIGASIAPYPLREDDGWQPDADELRRSVTEKTRAILLINPNNPTGGVAGRKTVQQVVDIAGERGIPIISDEIYDQLLYDGAAHVPAASLTTDVPVFTFNGLSKNYLAPGWRAGWIIESNIEPSSACASTINNLLDARLCSPTPPQFAIKAALEGPQEHLAQTVAKMQERATITFERLNAITGVSCVMPRAAFYAFPCITSTKHADDKQWVLELMEREGVVVVHGSGFGQQKGTMHFRVAFLPQPDILHEAYDRIERFMQTAR